MSDDGEATEGVGSVEDRVSALLSGALAPADDDDADDSSPGADSPAAGEQGPPPSSAADSSAPEPPAPTVDERTAARRARLAALAKQQQESVDARSQSRALEELRAQLAEERARREALEKRNVLDPEALDEDGVLRLLHAKSVDPSKIAERLRQALTDPEAVAAREAQRAVDPRVRAIEELIARQNAALEELRNERRAERAAAAERDAERAFMARVSEEHAPTSFRLLKANEGRFLSEARRAAETLPPGAGPDALLDTLEERLTEEASVWGALVQNGQASPKATESTKRPKAKGVTVPNTLARERATVADEDADFASLSLEDRVAAVVASYGRK